MRLSPAVLKLGSKRPEVANLRGAFAAIGVDCGDGHPCHVDRHLERVIREYQVDRFNGVHDGRVGPQTCGALLAEASDAGWAPDPDRQIQTVIGYYETSGARSAYGMTSRLADGAGYNYGVLQHNALGSLVRVLRMGDREDLVTEYRRYDKSQRVAAIADWMDSAAGIDAQDRYYREVVCTLAADAAKVVMPAFEGSDPIWLQRLRLLCIDSITQNGALFSPKRKPFWWSCTPEEERSAKFRELRDGADFDALGLKYMGTPLTLAEVKQHWKTYDEVSLDRLDTNQRTCAHIIGDMSSPLHRLILLAQWRARSSSPKWWRDVEGRRMLDAAGRGRVHREDLDLVADFAFPPA